MAVGDELRKSFASDASTYGLGIQARQVASNDAEALASVITNKKPAAKPAAHRSGVTAADAADLSSATGNKDLGNSMHAALWIEFTSANSQAQVFLALYDDAGTPALIGVTDTKTIGASGTYRISASGKYVSPMVIFDCALASRAIAKVAGLTASESIDIYLAPL